MSLGRSFMLMGWMLALFVPAVTLAGPLGAFEDHADIGKPKLAGHATWNAASQEYVVTAGGVNMWEARDEFHMAWRKLQGDFILQARVEFLGKGVDPHRKAGLIVRSSLDDDSPYVDGALHAGDGLTSLQFRRSEGALTEQLEAAVKGADVVQLERRGDTYIFSAARFGEPFVTREIAALKLGETVYAGLFMCSHNGDVTETAVFRNVRVIRPAKADFVPYRDYIGSVMELLDVNTGVRQVIRYSKEPFEAPNWTADGTALIYNTSGRGEGRGRLYRFDLATRQPALIDTGFAIRNNNDHVLSFDGSMLGISDQSTDQKPVHDFHAARGRRHAETHHAAHAELSAQLVAGRQISAVHGRTQRRVRYLSDCRRWQRFGTATDERGWRGRWAGVQSGRRASSISTPSAAGACRSGACGRTARSNGS